MSRALVTVEPACPVARAARLMEREGIRHILVMEGDRLVGVVSHRDLRVAPGPPDPPVREDTPVARVMAEPPVATTPETSLVEAGRALLEQRIGALPVVEGPRPVGILTRADVLEALLSWAERAP